ncbi:hypothetical protein EYR38_001986 [Pleurotus pulmonarius]|nr:hypothetical protein EYR38_001986 [Pleurotus pulmonarius]
MQDTPISRNRFGYNGVLVGTQWSSLKECYLAGAHGHPQKGICGTCRKGAYSIVLSNAYKDDMDEGNQITYTGSGGHKMTAQPVKGRQTGDQTWTGGNKALKISYSTGKPVRVIRGSKLKSPYAPSYGYRYDGLYKVTEANRVKGSSGFLICRFKLIRDPGQPDIPTQEKDDCDNYKEDIDDYLSTDHEYSDEYSDGSDSDEDEDDPSESGDGVTRKEEEDGKGLRPQPRRKRKILRIESDEEAEEASSEDEGTGLLIRGKRRNVIESSSDEASDRGEGPSSGPAAPTRRPAFTSNSKLIRKDVPAQDL